MITKLAEKISNFHSKFFMYLGNKAKTSKLFALILTLMALYEICEHILGPTLAALWATGHLTFN